MSWDVGAGDASSGNLLADEVASGEGEADAPSSATTPLRYEDAATLLDIVPDVDQRVAETVLAELGVDMRRFPTLEHAAAWSAVRTQDTYLRARYERLMVRRGKKRAVVAVAHS